MIVETPEGATVEIFWQRRGPRPWSQVTALRFLAAYRPSREQLRGLRWLLSERADAGLIWRSSEQDILQRTAQLIASGALVVARYASLDRWPGSGFVLGSGPESSILFWRDQLRLSHDFHHMRESLTELRAAVIKGPAPKEKKKTREEEEAAAANQRYLGALRRMMNAAPGMPTLDHIRDEVFLDVVIGSLESRDLLPIYHRYPGRFEEQKTEKPAEATPVRPQSERLEPEDANTFDPTHNAAQQGAVLAEAAANGTPFIEICEAPPRGART